MIEASKGNSRVARSVVDRDGRLIPRREHGHVLVVEAVKEPEILSRERRTCARPGAKAVS